MTYGRRQQRRERHARVKTSGSNEGSGDNDGAATVSSASHDDGTGDEPCIHDSSDDSDAIVGALLGTHFDDGAVGGACERSKYNENEDVSEGLWRQRERGCWRRRRRRQRRRAQRAQGAP